MLKWEEQIKQDVQNKTTDVSFCKMCIILQLLFKGAHNRQR